MRRAELFLAVVDEAGDPAAEVFAVDDHVDEAVLQHELGGLEAVRQLDLDRLGDGARAREADKAARLTTPAANSLTSELVLYMIPS